MGSMTNSMVVLVITWFVPVDASALEQQLITTKQLLSDLTPMYTTSEPFETPVGHVDWCARYPEDCSKQEPVNVELNDYTFSLLVEINDLVNTSIEPVTDLKFYGREEWWEYPIRGYGDCEDYVLEKRRLLMAKGWPAAALLMTFVEATDEKGLTTGHLVLAAVTDVGDLILDNIQKDILPWQYSPHIIFGRQAAHDLVKWEVIDDIRGEELFTAVDIDLH